MDYDKQNLCIWTLLFRNTYVCIYVCINILIYLTYKNIHKLIYVYYQYIRAPLILLPKSFLHPISTLPFLCSCSSLQLLKCFTETKVVTFSWLFPVSSAFHFAIRSPICKEASWCHSPPQNSQRFSCVESQSLSTDKIWEKYRPSPSVSYPVSLLNTCVHQLNPASFPQICPKSVINFQVSHALLASILFVSLFA